MLIEREQEIAVLEQALEGAMGGSGSSVVIEGAAGKGKSALLGCAEELGRAAELRIARASASILERSFPFGVALQLLEPIWTGAGDDQRAALGAGPAAAAVALLQGQLPEALRSAGSHGYPLIHGLFRLACNVTTSNDDDRDARPLIVLVDDVQWADRPSLRFLAYLAARCHDVAITLITTLRTGEAPADRAAVAALHHGRAGQMLRPAALGERGVAMIVRAHLPAASPAFVSACHRVTRGNPFLLVELLTHMRADRRAPDAETAERLNDLAPEAIVNAVVARLGALSPPARSLATAVAVLGDNIALSDAAQLAELELGTAAQAADALAALQLLGPGTPLSFVHPVIRSAVLASMSPLHRGQAHRRAAKLLRAACAPPSAAAAHLLAVPAEGDAEAVETLRLAARDCLQSGEAESATRLLERALVECPSHELRAAVLAELGAAAALAGLPQAPERLGDAIRITEEPERRAELALTQGRALMSQGRYADGAAVFETGLHEVGSQSTSLSETLDEAYICAASLVPRLVAEARSRRDEMLQRCKQAPGRGQRSALARTLMQDSLAGERRSTIGRLGELAWSDGALLADDPTDHLTLSALAGALLFVDELERAVEICDAMLAVAREQDSPLEQSTVSHCRTWPLYEQGAIDLAAAEARAALDAPGDGGTQVRTSYGAIACCQLQRGQLEEAEHALAMIEQEDVTQSIRHPFLLDVRAQLRLAQHRPREALEDAMHAGRRLRSDFEVFNPGVVAWRSTAALALLALGDPAGAEEFAATEFEEAQRIGVERVMIRSLRVLGLATRGRAGIELLEQAVTIADRYPVRLESLHAYVDYGAALRRVKQRAASREPLRKALKLSHLMGASAIAARAHTELAASGARPRRLLLSGVAALTPSERRVADLAAQGMTTRQIAESLYVTPKTIEYHLRHTYRKLDVGSRSELTDALRTENAA